MTSRSGRAPLSSSGCPYREADRNFRNRKVGPQAAAGKKSDNSRRFPQGADYCGLCELLDRMACSSLAQKKYSTMNRRAAPLTVLLFSLALSVSPVRADELQDIDSLLKRGQHAQALERVNQYLAHNPSDAQ